MDKYVTIQQRNAEALELSSDSEENSGPSTSKKKYVQKSRKSWLNDRRFSKWLIGLDEQVLKCKYCSCFLQPRLSTILAHGKTSKHVAAASSFCKNQMTIDFQALKNSNNVKEAELLEALYVAVHTSLRSSDHLVALQKNIFNDSKAAVNMTLGRSKCTAPHFLQLLTEDIDDGYYSLIIDESTDISIEKYLGIVIRYYSKALKKIVNTFLNLSCLEDSTANGIFQAILKVLNHLNLKISNMVGLGTDNAKVMTGINRGVIAKLQEKNKNIILIPCVCHSIQLSVSSASKTLPIEIEYLVSETYNWFSKSSIRQKNYKNIYAAINDGMQPLKLVRACDIRWLSIESAASRIEKQWLELKTHFEIAATVESCHQAKILKKNV